LKLPSRNTTIEAKLIILLLLWLPVQLSAQTPIRQIIQHNKGSLYYPRSVERFYHANGYQLAWVAPDTVKSHVYDAMLLLDCVRQYGLSHADYHPKQLLYITLQKLVKNQGTKDEESAFDILMTDAMIRFINNLHYGKLNPVYTPTKLDRGAKFNADAALLAALKNHDFLTAIDSVQPKSKLYIDLQNHMRLLAGQRTSDCYEIPEALIQKMAINMERLRWISTTGKKVHLTLIVRSGDVIEYRDVYKKDKSLTKTFYNRSPGRLNKSSMSLILSRK
jgi:murein L,D-transpeptidase YcbB/YkuD